MSDSKFELAAEGFLELASEQRLLILSNLNTKPYRVSMLAKKLDVTAQEVHRNLDRLAKSGFVIKGNDEHFHITTIGKILFSQMSLIVFVSKNKVFFKGHDINVMPLKYVKRLGVLEDCEHIKGVTKVLDKWKAIYKNSKEYIKDVISESPPGTDEAIINSIKKGAVYNHIISKDLSEPQDRIDKLKKLGYYELIKKGKIKRKTADTIGVVLLINEKEAAVIFPTNDGEPDLRHMFYGKDLLFHEWCVDYFDYFWKKAKKQSREHPKK
ncbi:MAG: transcriptional regulator [Nitrosopumilaceae archaeon]|nr:transcriptional regulator [Nitrosopumilaceae archaeon]